jgi:hypothetical protein
MRTTSKLGFAAPAGADGAAAPEAAGEDCKADTLEEAGAGAAADGGDTCVAELAEADGLDGPLPPCPAGGVTLAAGRSKAAGGVVVVDVNRKAATAIAQIATTPAIAATIIGFVNGIMCAFGSPPGQISIALLW